MKIGAASVLWYLPCVVWLLGGNWVRDPGLRKRGYFLQTSYMVGLLSLLDRQQLNFARMPTGAPSGRRDVQWADVLALFAEHG